MKKNLLKTAVAILVALSMLMGTGAFAAAGMTKTANGRLVISESGVYTLTGNMKGSVYVDAGAGEVTLVLDNVRITGGNESGIIGESGDLLRIRLASGSSNTIVGGNTGAAVTANMDVRFEGEGNLNLSGLEGINVRNGSLEFDGGNYTIFSSRSAIQASKGYTILSGNVLALGREEVDVPAAGASQMLAMETFDSSVKEGSVVTLKTDDGYTVVSFTAEEPFDTALMSYEGNENNAPSLYVDEVPVADAETFDYYKEAAAPAKTAADAEDKKADAAVTPAEGIPQVPETAAQEQTVPAADARESSSASSAGSTAQQQPSFPSDTQSASFPSDTQSASFPTDRQMPSFPSDQQGMGGQQGSFPGMGQQMGMNTAYTSAESASEIVYGTATNSAASLTADYDNATYYTMDDDENSQVTISDSGTYVITGSSSDGNITVKKNTTGVVLVLDDLDLTSTTGATVSLNKNTEVQVIVQGNVTLTDNENPEDENSTDEEIADAFDGAGLKAKDGSVVYLTGDGTLTIHGNAKNGIKTGDESSFVIDGDVTVNIDAVNDGINANYDLTILDATVTINAGDDAIHADHILTIGDAETGKGPTITVTGSVEGMEGTVVNIFGGDISLVSSDDTINAANGDALYEGVLEYSFNMTGGTLAITSGGDGIDSNGNVNLIAGSADIRSASVGGEAGIDYVGQLYISEDFELNNQSGVFTDGMNGAMPGAMGDMGQTGTMPTDMGQTGTMPGSTSQTGTFPTDMGQNGTMPTDMNQTGTFPTDMGQSGSMPGGMNQNGTMPSDMGGMAPSGGMSQSQQGPMGQQGTNPFEAQETEGE